MSHPSSSKLPGSIDIVDAQLHMTLSLTEEKILASMDALAIQSIVIDEFWGMNERMQGTPCISFPDGSHRPVSPYALAASIKHPERFSFLQRVERLDPHLSEHLAILASTPGCRALRLVLLHPVERHAFLQGGHDLLLSLAQQYKLPVCILGTEVGQLLRDVAPRYPDLPFILDHCGWPKSTQQWEDVLALAQFPNVWLKWSHAYKPFARGEQPQAALQQELLRALAAFGSERILWASDVTHEESGASWSQLLSFIIDNPALSRHDKEWILGKTARKVFRWDAVTQHSQK